MPSRRMHLFLVLAVLAFVACDSFASATPTPTVGTSPTAGANVPLRVLVTRTGGGPAVAGARVCASRGSAATPACATAGTDGAVTLFGSQGTYFVRVSGPAEQHWQEVTRVADLSSGAAALWVELQPLH